MSLIIIGIILNITGLVHKFLKILRIYLDITFWLICFNYLMPYSARGNKNFYVVGATKGTYYVHSDEEMIFVDIYFFFIPIDIFKVPHRICIFYSFKIYLITLIN